MKNDNDEYIRQIKFALKLALQEEDEAAKALETAKREFPDGHRKLNAAKRRLANARKITLSARNVVDRARP